MDGRNDRTAAETGDRSTVEKAKDKGQELAAEAKHKVEDVANKAEETMSAAADKAGDLASGAAEKAGDLASGAADKAGRMASSKAEEQKDRVVEGIHSVADALRRGSERLPEGEQQYAPYVNRLADGVDRVSTFLERKDVREMSTDVERFAREHTAMFLSSAFALGLLGARFAKSSSQQARRYENLPAPTQYTPEHGRLPSHMEQGQYVPPRESELGRSDLGASDLGTRGGYA